MNLTSQFSNQIMPETVLGNILMNIPGHVYWKDLEGVYLGCNDRQAQSLGLHYGAEVVGKTDFDLPWGHDIAQKFRDNDLYVIQSGESLILEEPACLGGKHLTLLSIKVPLKNIAGKIIGILGISIDITQQKMIEKKLSEERKKLEIANHIKTEFLKNMRHDLRTPLSGIIGSANMIQKRATDPFIQNEAHHLVTASQTLLEFLNEIIESVHLSEDIPLAKKKFKLKDKLHEAIRLHQVKADEKELQLYFHYDESIPTYLLGDAKRISRIVLELLGNALNFTHQGEVNLIVQLMKEEEHRVIVSIAVQDTGIGIPKDKQEEVFLRFQRLSPSYEGIYKGAGLGLAVVKEFIDDLHGEIHVESQLNQGSTFTCFLALQKALIEDERGLDVTPIVIPKKYINSPKTVLSKFTPKEADTKHILLVEDQAIAAHATQLIFIERGYAVNVAKNGKEAIEQVKEKHYDLMLLDLGLPDIHGLEVAKQMRTRGFYSPIVALSAHVDPEDEKACLSAGINAVLVKPLREEMIDEFLSALIPQVSTSTLSLYDLPDKIIDLSLGAQIIGRDETEAKEMLGLLIEALPEEINLLTKAYSSQDWTTIAEVAHKLHGGASYCGVPRLKEACVQLENYLRSEQTVERAKLYRQLLQEIKAFQLAFEKLTDSHR